eukprot:2287771-Amphidinium_carterae.1
MDDTRGGQQVDSWQAWMSETKPEDGPEPKASRGLSRDLLTGFVGQLPSVQQASVSPSLGVDSVARFEVKQDAWSQAFSGKSPQTDSPQRASPPPGLFSTPQNSNLSEQED